jgi:hypothetical protein
MVHYVASSLRLRTRVCVRMGPIVNAPRVAAVLGGPFDFWRAADGEGLQRAERRDAIVLTHESTANYSGKAQPLGPIYAARIYAAICGPSRWELRILRIVSRIVRNGLPATHYWPPPSARTIGLLITNSLLTAILFLWIKSSDFVHWCARMKCNRRSGLEGGGGVESHWLFILAPDVLENTKVMLTFEISTGLSIQKCPVRLFT